MLLGRIALPPALAVRQHSLAGEDRRIQEGGQVRRVAGPGARQPRPERPFDLNGGVVGARMQPVNRTWRIRPSAGQAGFALLTARSR